ncbi:MAG: Lrp/AsnC family transcriptional regulator [Candidatus Micrarchaeia archaeon]
MEKYTLDKLDRKILSELELNSRQSYPKIAKKCRTSKEVVNYRVKNLVKNGVIIRFFTEINLAKFGLQIYKIYFQFQNLTEEKEKEMYSYFTQELGIPWVISCSGKYDMIISFGAKDVHHFDEYLTRIMDKFSEYILNKEVSATSFFITYNRKWINNSHIIKKTTVGGKLEQPSIDELDYKILAYLSDNSRIHIIDLATNVNLTSGAVIERIKKMERNGIINAYRIGLDYKKLGKEFCKSFIYLKSKTSEKEKKLIAYIEQLPEIFTVIKSVGSWDIEFEFIVDNFHEFHSIMKILREKFDFIRNYESVIISKEYGINYFHFI